MQIWVLIHYSAFTSSHRCCLKCATSSRSSANKGHRMKGKLNMNVRSRLKWRGFTCTSQRWPSRNVQGRALSSQQIVEVCNHPSIFLKCWKKILNYSETQLLLLPSPHLSQPGKCSILYELLSTQQFDWLYIKLSFCSSLVHLTQGRILH